jgi:multicomponent Na+:H+ antiporter subunit E
LFVLNVLLAFAWAFVNGSSAPRDVAVGFVVGFLILWLAIPKAERSAYHGRLARIVPFTVWYVGELVLCNWRVARDVLTPVLRNQPGIVAIPLDVESDAEITALANLVSLTPGTLSLSLSKDRRHLFVHFMDVDPTQVEQIRQEIKEGIERRVLSMSRGSQVPRVLGEETP